MHFIYFGLVLLQAFQHIYIKSKLPDNVVFVKFEDMHTDTPSTMRSVSDFLGVIYNDTLLKSTFNGELWWGNNPAKSANGSINRFVSGWASKIFASHVDPDLSQPKMKI